MIFVMALILSLNSTLFEVYSIYIRAKVSSHGKMALLGFVGWVQYLARIFLVLSVALLVFDFEINGRSNIKEFIVLYAVNSLLIMVLCINRRELSVAIKALVGIFSFFNYKEQAKINYWTKLVRPNLRVTSIAFFVYSFLTVAVYVPLILAQIYPKYRMTMSVTSQIGNFFGTAIFFAILEPIYLKHVDDKNEKIITSSMFVGRLLSVFIVMLAAFML